MQHENFQKKEKTLDRTVTVWIMMRLSIEIHIKERRKSMKKKKWIKIAIGAAAALTGVLLVCFGEKIKTICVSLNSFRDENLAHTFQHTPEIQPTKKISCGDSTFEFAKDRKSVV